MFGLRSDMSGLYRICPVGEWICPIKRRLGAKMMNICSDKLTTSKQDTIEDIEIKGTTRCNPNTRNHT
jgi:hypothetical protein